MVVTVGALNLDAQENSRAFGRQFIGLAALREDQSGFAMIGDGSRCGDQRRHDLVPAIVLVDLIGHPFLERALDDPGFHIARAEKDHIAPVFGPVVGVFVALEQALDDLVPLLGIGIEAEQRDLPRAGHCSGQVEVDASQEVLV
jgi:hypothetical protein